MKKGLTELVFILDRSGSMGGLENDTIGGYNSLLDKQREVEGECHLTTVLFDHDYELLHDRLDIRAVGSLTGKDYFVRGSTALMDAVGRTIQKISNAQKHTAEDYRAEKVVFVIITDGYENASREYTVEQIRALIERQKTNYGWEFIFLGANIDAVNAAEMYGISGDRAQNFHADADGVRLSMKVVSDAVAQMRSGVAMSPDWKARIDRDYRMRRPRR